MSIVIQLGFVSTWLILDSLILLPQRALNILVKLFLNALLDNFYEFAID